MLPYGTPEEVRTEVRRLIDILGPDGGYVLSSAHNLMGDVPPENIVAMYDEAARYYPFSEADRGYRRIRHRPGDWCRCARVPYGHWRGYGS